MPGSDTPTVSVIIPCYNSGASIERALDSALSQNCEALELIVVDDGSSDDSAQRVESCSDSRIRLIRQANQGVSAARNRGIEAASGRYLAFLDADDTWSPEFLRLMVEVLENKPDAVLAYCGWQNLGLPGKRGEPFVPADYERPDKLETLFTGCRWPIHAALVRRQAVVSAGGFDQELKNAEDFLLWLNLGARSPIVRVPEVLAFYHFGDGAQASGNRGRAAEHHMRAQLSFLKTNPDLAARLGRRHAHRLIYRELAQRGYECYWSRDLDGARRIFRQVLRAGAARPKDLKYMLPALLPAALHRRLLGQAGRPQEKPAP